MHKEVACKWFRKALKDLKWAKIMLTDGDLDYATFHSQQAAEKALKALLIAHNRRPPRTHNISQLLNELENARAETGEIRHAKILTDYAVKARYLDFEEEITVDEAVEALNSAKTV